MDPSPSEHPPAGPEPEIQQPQQNQHAKWGVPGAVALTLSIASLAFILVYEFAPILAIAGLVLGVSVRAFLAGKRGATATILLSILALTIAFMFGSPSYIHGGRELANRAICRTNLSHIGRAMAMYGAENDDAYPASLEALVTARRLEQKELCCPSTNDGGVDYFYLPPAPGTLYGTLVACDYSGNHEGLRNLLRHDGSVGELTEEEFQQTLAEPRNIAFAEALRQAESKRRE